MKNGGNAKARASEKVLATEPYLVEGVWVLPKGWDGEDYSKWRKLQGRPNARNEWLIAQRLKRYTNAAAASKRRKGTEAWCDKCHSFGHYARKCRR